MASGLGYWGKDIYFKLCQNYTDIFTFHCILCCTDIFCTLQLILCFTHAYTLLWNPSIKSTETRPALALLRKPAESWIEKKPRHLHLLRNRSKSLILWPRRRTHIELYSTTPPCGMESRVGCSVARTLTIQLQRSTKLPAHWIFRVR